MWTRKRKLTDPVVEAKSPKPPPERSTPPIGYGTQVDPINAADRKDAATIVAAALQTAQEQGRQVRYAQFDAMDTADIAAQIDAVVDGVVTFDDVASGRGFKVECDDPAANEILQSAITRNHLDQLTEEITRDIVKYGDGFFEPLFTNGVLTGVQTYPPAEIFVNRDDKNQFSALRDADGRPIAYQQKRDGAVVAGWLPWEMIHVRLVPQRKLFYSAYSLLDNIREDWQKLQLVEQGMVVARLTRAYPRRVHYLDVTNADRPAQERTLREYIRRVTQRVFGARPTTDTGLPSNDVSEDLFLTTGYVSGPDGKLYPKLNRVETEDPAIAGLAEHGDVLYLRQKVWSRVPADVVGIRRNTSGDMDSQDLAYTRLLRRCQRQIQDALRQLFNQVLLAAGYLPDEVEYTIVLPAIDVRASWKHADARFRHSLTLRNFLEMGALSRRSALKEAFNYSDREVDREWENVGEEAQNPIFLPVSINRNGAPSLVPSTDDPNGDGEKDPQPTSPSFIPATGAIVGKDSTTKNGISRGTDIGMGVRGSISGG